MRDRIVEALKRKPRVTYGYLAEDYDGIGQYVMVSLSRASTAVVARARVATGDFGGGRRIPAGSRVTVLSRHGYIEVLLGNQPRVVNCDPFSRNIAELPAVPIQPGSWGKGPIGTWWSPDAYYKENPRPGIHPPYYDSNIGSAGEVLDDDIYEDYFLSTPWNTRAWVEDGHAKISYRIDESDQYDTEGDDPTQLIEINGLPKRITFDFRSDPTSYGFEWQFYLGYEYHWVWDEWLGVYVIKQKDERPGINDDSIIDPFSGQQSSFDPWSFWDVEVFDQEAELSLEEIRAPHRLLVDINEEGMFTKLWRTDTESEPADYMAWQRYTDAGGLFVPKEYFRVLYIEQFTFLSNLTLPGFRTHENQNMGVTQFDKICIYY